jgi:hypothetical protein
MHSRSSRLIAGLAVLIVVILGCGAPTATLAPTTTSPPTPVEPTQPPATPASTNTPQPPAEHHIGVRQVDGRGEFYDKRTEETFIPRGVNYAFVPIGTTYGNKVLQVGTYDPQRTRDDFARLASLEYNTVRVFLDHCSAGPGCITTTDQPGLNPAYLDNIADMMLVARETGVYILFTSNDLPDAGGYADEANQGSGEDFSGYRNSYYLRPQAISATRRYWRDLLTGLKERNAAFDAILGWQLLNEQWMFIDKPPLSLTSGTVETTTGSYDMGDPEQKKQMVSDGLIYYIAQMKEEILLHDPTALVTMGFFVPELVAPGWYVETASLLERSDLDFFDFHAYPGPISLQAHAEAFGMLGFDAKPIVMGEYGPFRHLFADIEPAARVTGRWVAESCEYGFDGWLYWTYYPDAAGVGDRTWGLVDEDGYLLKLFAPKNQPDPCVAVKQPGDSVAYNKPVLASSSLPEEPPTHAVDDNDATQWGAGADAPQWIEIDLAGTYHITEIRLLVAQWPEGETLHRIQIRPSSADEYATVHEFAGTTADNDWLVFAPDVPLEDVGYVRILTVSSPSWVAWKEIRVIGKETQP